MTRDRRSERVPTNLLRSQVPLSSSFIVFCNFKETKKSQFLSFIIDEICKSPFTTKSPSTVQNRLSRQTKQNRLSRHFKILSLSLNICAMES